jgi:hypothetical protein
MIIVVAHAIYTTFPAIRVSILAASISDRRGVGHIIVARSRPMHIMITGSYQGFARRDRLLMII